MLFFKFFLFLILFFFGLTFRRVAVVVVVVVLSGGLLSVDRGPVQAEAFEGVGQRRGRRRFSRQRRRSLQKAENVLQLLHLGEMLLRVVIKHHFHAVVNGQL